MYKLFLCLRYLRSRLLAIIAMLAVSLCAFMLIVAVSVMNGFVDKLEDAAKGLFGDVIIEGTSATGFGLYDEFIAEMTDPETGVEHVEAASPFIHTGGLLRVPGDSDFQRVVQIAGIRLPQRSAVTDFQEGLWMQKDLPHASWDPNFSLLIDRLREEMREVEQFARQLEEGGEEALPANVAATIARARSAQHQMGYGLSALQQARPYQPAIRKMLDRLSAARETAGGGEMTDEMVELEDKLFELLQKAAVRPPGERAIVGARIPGFSFRTDFGRTVRFMVPGHDIVLVVFPIGRRITETDISLPKRRLTVIDEAATDIYQIDSQYVFIPFETAQMLNDMSAREDPNDPSRIVRPARTSSIHVKVDPALGGDETKLRHIAVEIEKRWAAFREKNPLAWAGSDVEVGTWRQRQAKVIAPIQAQRTLVAIMFGIMSLVAPAVIFVIFYMIVVQKTKDIGVLKAIGASSPGVAGIFLAYGALVGVAGALVGLVGGFFFVKNINPVHDWMGRTMGFQVWSPETFLFTEIPNQVDWAAAVLIVVGAALAGVAGALVPAVHAARMQPVEALRYE
ncbi:MAG: FtsX-like permease family protein [Phycisphaerae bacterium]